jgi:branched-chain amino acid transport system ATP-binding protein
MSAEFFKVESVEAGYGDIQVLWGVEIDVQEGEIVCIVGSNGAGKSTLLRCIAGVIPAQSGKIVMRGVDLSAATPDQVLTSGIALVPEGRRLFPGMSVKNNLLMGAYLRRDKQIRKDLEFVSSIAGTLSGGEQQMCALARGIMSRPALLMVDELSLGLAPLVVEDLSKALQNVNQSGISILLVEQDVITAFELARRGCVLESGRVTISGFTSDLADDQTVREAYMGI